MNKFLKYSLIGAGAVVGVVAAGITYVAVTFNPNDYKGKIIQAVKENAQRNLRLDGDIKLTFFPSLGADMSKVSLSEFKNDREFVAVESARVSVALLPLLRKQVVVNEVAVSGLKATLVKRADGTFNFDDLMGKDENEQAAKLPVKFDIASVTLSDANLTYRDEGVGAKYVIKDLNLKTGRIAIGVPSKIDLSVEVQANKPKLDISTQLKTTLTFDLEKQQFQFEGLDMQISGAILDISNMKTKVNGDAKANLATQEFSAQKFALAATGVKAKDHFDVVLNAPALSLAKNKLSGEKLALNAKLDGATGNIAAALSVPGLEGDLKAFKASGLSLDLKMKLPKPKLDIAAQLKGSLTVDTETQSFEFKGLDLQASGSALDMSDLKIKASGDADANLSTKEFGAQKFSMQATGVKVATGTKDRDSFEVALDAPQLSLTKNKFSGDKLTLNTKLDGAFGKVVASMSLPGVEGNEKSFRVSALVLDLDVKQPEQAFKVKLSSPVSGSIQAQQINLSNLVIAVKATGDKLPNKSVSSEMKGSVQIDAVKESVQANLAGGLLQSKVKAKVDVKGFDKPAIKFDLDVDQFDADLYLPKPPATAAAPKVKEPEQPLDLSALRTLNLDGSLRIGSLKVANVKSSQVRLDVKAHNGLVTLNPLSANLYQGSMSGSLSVNAKATPSITINQSMSGISIAPLLKDALDLDMLEGKGNVAINFAMQGDTISAMKKAANGNLSIDLANGALKGIDIDKKLRAAQAMLNKGGGTRETQSANKDERTEFKEFKATFKVTNGVAHNDDLSLKSQLIKVTGAGDVNIGNDSIDYTAKAAIPKTPDGQGGITVPLRVSGPFTDLKYTVDYGAMVKEVVKQKVDAKVDAVKEDLKAKAQEQLKGKLKGLFK